MVKQQSVLHRISLVAWLLQALLRVTPVGAFSPFSKLEFASCCRQRRTVFTTLLFSNSNNNNNEPTFYNDFEDYNNNEEDDDDDDEFIDTANLGDWRAFRKSLTGDSKSLESHSKENEKVLRTQSEFLADEYTNQVWAQATPVPEVGGFLARMPLEVEIYRNHKHSMMGKKLRKKYESQKLVEGGMVWYRNAKLLVEEEMQKIANQAEHGQIDYSSLDEESTEMLQLYLDNQETWQEICLVTSRDESSGTATSLVLNRPMAFKLTENLAQLVLRGGTGSRLKPSTVSNVDQFMAAFGNECAIYVGGPDGQEEPATLIHGFAELPGSREIVPGVYMGGVDAAIDGVKKGLYKALDFRFFVGRHDYEESMLDLDVVLGKYQPIAGARTLALKQCISLPKPLWHEVLELCGGDLKEISELEKLKRDDVEYEFVDEGELDDDIVVIDELDELFVDDDDDDDDGDDLLNFLN